jgi:tetratricopeptide (TPR) repeat protein
VGRNDPCPCGSGKRYKNCHGALAPPPPGPALPSPEIRAKMFEALDFQRRGELSAAKALYEEVIAQDPDNFDVLHMLGVVEYQRRSYYRAERLILRALEIQPNADAAHRNLQLVRSALGLESELCRRILAGIARRQPPAPERWPAPLHFIASSIREPALARQCRMRLSEASPEMVVWEQGDDGRLSGADGRPVPRGGSLVLVGSHFLCGSWIAEASAERVVLLCAEGQACAIHDALLAGTRELSTPASLVCLSGEAAREVAWPAPVVGPDHIVEFLLTQTQH